MKMSLVGENKRTGENSVLTEFSEKAVRLNTGARTRNGLLLGEVAILKDYTNYFLIAGIRLENINGT